MSGINVPDVAKMAAIFGCTVEQAKKQIALNAAGLLWMADQAKKKKSGTYNNFPESYLRKKAAEYADAAK